MRVRPSVLMTVFALLQLQAIRALAEAPSVLLLDGFYLAEIRRQVLEKVGPRRGATQIEPDGRMPHELARTKSFSYTHMNLRGFLHLARLAEHVGVDLWRYRSADGRSIEAALDWLEPFVAGRTDWNYEQIAPFEPSSARLLYRRAARQFDKPAYRALSLAVEDPVEDFLWPKP